MQIKQNIPKLQISDFPISTKVRLDLAALLVGTLRTTHTLTSFVRSLQTLQLRNNRNSCAYFLTGCIYRYNETNYCRLIHLKADQSFFTELCHVGTAHSFALNTPYVRLHDFPHNIIHRRKKFRKT